MSGERVGGIARGRGVLVRRGTLRVDGTEHSAAAAAEAFELEIEGGSVVTVEVTPRTEIGPPRQARASWGELAEHPLAGAFVDRAPGDHVEVVLEGSAIRAGDRVCAEGEVERRAEGDGYRGAGERVPVRVRAARIGVGGDAEAWLDPPAPSEAERREADARAAERARAAAARAKEERARAEQHGRELPMVGPAIAIVLGGLGFAFGIAASVLELGAHVPRFVAFAVGAQLLALGLLWWRVRRFLPRLRVAGTSDSGHEIFFHVGGWEWLTVTGIVISVVGVLGLAFREDYAVASSVIVAILVAIQAAVLLQRSRGDAAKLAVMAKAARAEGDGWGLREGVVEEGLVTRTRTHTHHEGTSTESYTDDKGQVQTREVHRTWWTFAEKSGTARLRVRLGERVVTVELTTPALWATTRRRLEEGPTLHEEIRPGDRVALLGRIAEHAMRPTGAESLFVLATPEGSPVDALRRGLWAHRAVPASMLAIATVTLVLGWRNVMSDHTSVSGRVTGSTHPEVAVGDACTIELAHRPDGRSTEGSRCQAVVRCGDETLFGGIDEGYLDCDPARLTGGDRLTSDGDPAFVMEGARARTESEEGERVQIAVDGHPR